MNKKGSLVHWIIFAFFIALGMFFLFFNQIEVLQGIQGQWHLDFLNQLYLPSEQEQQVIDAIARQEALMAVQGFQLNGGYNAGEDSPCGRVQGLNVWKEGCYPSVRAEVAEKIAQNMQQRIPGTAFRDVGFRGETFYGKGPMRVRNTSFARYSYDTSFSVPLGYDLAEFEQVISEARGVEYACRNVKTLESCLMAAKPSHWHYTSCRRESTDIFPNDTKLIPFCVASPGGYVLPLGEVEAVPWPVQYHFALDFTPSTALATTDLDAVYNSELNLFELHFQRDREADLYKVYYTDYTILEGRTGRVRDTFGTVPSEGFFHDSLTVRQIDLRLDAAACTSSGAKEANVGYLCGEEVVLTVSDERFTDQQLYVFGVTTWMNSTESEVGIIVGERKK